MITETSARVIVAQKGYRSKVGIRALMCGAAAAFWLLLAGSLPLEAAVYYVSSGGTEAGDGSAAAPWNSVAKAIAAAGPGDTVILLPGTYAEPVSIDKRSGEAGAPIVFRAQGSVTATANWNIGTYSTPRHYIIVDGLRFTNAGLTSRGDYNIIQNCVFEGPSGGLGISWHPSADPPSANVVVRGNRFQNFGKVVVLNTGAKTSHVLIENNVWENLEGDAVRLFGRNHIFRGNVVRGVTETGWHADIFQVYDNNLEPSLNMLIEGNRFLDSTGSLCMIQNRGGTSEIGAWEWRNNLIVNVAGVCQISTPYFRFYNNTFVNSGKNTAGPILLRYDGDSEYSFAHDTTILNNIFSGCGSLGDGDGDGVGWYHFADRPESTFYGLVADYNYVTKSASAGYGAKSGFEGKEPHGINGGDPKFQNPATYDFRLQADSPGVDTGTRISGFSVAIDGTTRPQGTAWDRGAYERAGAKQVTAPDPPKNFRLRAGQ
jgi:hypothetical protein